MSRNFCMPFKLHSPYTSYENAAEFDIIFKKDSSLDNLLDFLNEYSDKRINIIFDKDEVNYPILKTISKMEFNFAVKLNSRMMREVKQLKELNIPFYFDNTLAATSLCTLDAMFALGVSDVYIADDLCYNMSQTHALCASKNVKIRLILNRIPNTTSLRGSDYRSVVPLPQDFEALTYYVDIFEIDCGEKLDFAVFDVCYRAFFEKGKWNGNIQEINKDLAYPIYDKSIMPQYSWKRFNCGRRCSKRPNAKCDTCETMYRLSQLFVEKGLAII